MPLVIDAQVLQLLVIFGPIIFTVVLGPLLIALVNRAKTHAEAENYEVISDKTRVEAMDLLVKNLREEIVRVVTQVAELRSENTDLRQRNRTLEEQVMYDEKILAEAIRWALILYSDLKALSQTPVEPPVRVQSVMEDREIDSKRVFIKKSETTKKQIEG